MTNEEAIKELKILREDYWDEYGDTMPALDIAIKALEQETCDGWNEVLDELNRIGRNAFKDDTDYDNLFDFISGLPNVKQEPKTGWIPVSGRLPEEFQRVLVTIVNYNGAKVVRVAEYYNRVFRIKENHEQWKVGEKGLLAWAPLPKPYESQESEKTE